jgi:hypothetical protein
MSARGLQNTSTKKDCIFKSFGSTFEKQRKTEYIIIIYISDYDFNSEIKPICEYVQSTSSTSYALAYF